MTTEAELRLKVDSSEVSKAGKSLDDLAGKSDKAEKSTGSLTQSAVKLAAAYVSFNTLQAGFRAFLSTVTETEKLRGSLETMTGSADNAAAAFDNLTGFAAKTPFTLDQSVNAFIKLKALGLDPSERAMTSYGNTAAAMGKDMTQMIEAVADASTGEFERLKEFGIKASKQGDDVSLVFQGVTTTIKNDSAAIQEYLMNIGETKFGDAMANQMERLPGKLSNLEDATAGLWRTIGDAGATNILISGIEMATGAIEGLASMIRASTTDILDQAFAFDKVRESLARLTDEELTAHAMALQIDIDKTQDSIREKEYMLKALNPLTDAYISISEQIRLLRVEEEALLSNQKAVTDQLHRVQAGFVPLTAATENASEATGEFSTAQKKARDETAKFVTAQKTELAQMQMSDLQREVSNALIEAGTERTGEQTVEIIANTTAMYEQAAAAKQTAEEWDALTKELEALGKKQVSDAEKAAEKIERANEAAALKAADDWRAFHADLSSMIVDAWDGEGSITDRIGSAFENLLKKMAADLIASGIMKFLTGQTGGFTIGGALSGSGVTGQIVGAGLSKFAPSLAASLGLGAAGTAMTGASIAAGVMPTALGGAGVATLAPGAGVLALGSGGGVLATGAAGAGAGAAATGGLSGALAAIPGWGWALAGIGALGMMLNKESTPSYNAGFLTDPSTPLGKSGQSFQTDAFASGFAPTGFYRRSTQAEAEQVIDVFRELDAAIVKAAGPLKVSAAGVRGYAETGLGTGTVYGAAGEDGRPGTALEDQATQYARQLIASLTGQLDGEVINRVLAAGDSQAMVLELEKAVGMTDDMADSVGKLTDAQTRAVTSKDRLLDQYGTETDRLESARAQIRETFGEFGVAVPKSMEELRALIATIDPLTERGQAAIEALNGLSGAISTVSAAAGRSAGVAGGLDYATQIKLQAQTPRSGLVTGAADDARLAAVVPPAPTVSPPEPAGLNNAPPTTAVLSNMLHALNVIVANTGASGRALDEAVRNGGGSLAVVTV